MIMLEVYPRRSWTASTASARGVPGHSYRFDGKAPVIEAQVLAGAARAQIREHTCMDMIEHIKAGLFTHSSMAVIAVVGIVALILAMKIAHFIFKLILGLIALAAIGGAVWWFFLRS
jgi:hypothetical protein